MFLSQYSICLPADYDMGIIRRRVHDHGVKMDGYPGLGLKAYLLQEKGVRGARANCYAPFYRWEEVDGAARFFFGGQGFGGIVRDFGRPVVRSWVEGRHRTVADPVGAAAFATKSTSAIAAHLDPAEAAEQAEARLEQILQTDGALTSLFGIDLENWEILHLSLWAAAPDPSFGEIYEVLHVSGPAV